MNFRLLRGGGALLALCLLHDAHSLDLAWPGGPLRVSVASIKQLRFQTTLRQRYDFSCGSAAVATMLTHHYRYPVSEQQVFEQMFLHGDQRKIRKEGFSLLDMQRFLTTLGFKADGFQLPLQKLLDAKLPAIVLISVKGYHHFVVIKGGTADRILIGDPATGTHALTRTRFEAIWLNKLLFVIHGYPQAPTFNSPSDWRAAPAAPLKAGIDRGGLGNLAIPKLGPGDF
jgi:predicted double-glycine peptidase